MNTRPTGTRIDRFFPSAYPRTHWPVLEWIALFAVILFAVSNFLEPQVARKAEWILLLVTMFAGKQIRREDPDAWLYLALFGFLGLMLVVNWWATTQWGSGYNHFSYSRDYLRIFWFLMAGWWLGAKERSIFLVFAVTIVALFASIQIKGGVLSWQRLLAGDRVDFNIHNAQHVGVLFGTAFLGLLSFMFRFFDTRRPPLSRLAMGALWLLLFGGTLVVLLGTQTRQIWVGFAAAVVVISYYLFAKRRAQRVSIWRLCWIVIVLGLAIEVGQLIHSFAPMSNRLTQELYAVEQLNMHDMKDVPMNSATIRLALWQTAVDAISKRPWLGYGGAARRIVLERSDLPPVIRAQFGHFHNSYLELWLSYGIMGPLVFIGILGMLGWRLVSACQHGYLALDFAVFGLGWLVYFAVVNLFESYVNYRTGAYLMLIVGGALYSITIPARRAARGLRTIPLPGT